MKFLHHIYIVYKEGEFIMSLEFGKNYNIISHSGVGRLLTVFGNEVVDDATRVCLSDKRASAQSQEWVIKAEQDYAKVYTSLLGGKTHAININSARNPKCTMYTANGNDFDSLVDFLTVSAEKNLYRIKLKNYNLYLFAKDMVNFANVTWQTPSTADTASFIWKLATTGAPSESLYAWPTESTRVTQKFSVNNPHDGNKLHRGIDVGAKTPGLSGDNLYAFASGVVARVKNNVDNEGFTIRINHIGFVNPAVGNSFLQTRYLHLQTRAFLNEGQTVVKGQIIGKMGSTGNSTAAHLHFETVAKNSPFAMSASSGYYEGIPINPNLFFPEIK